MSAEIGFFGVVFSFSLFLSFFLSSLFLFFSLLSFSEKMYQSTRGGEKNVQFSEVMMRGLAGDGGLFVPSPLPPPLSSSTLLSWRTLDYPSLALEIFSLFIEESDIPREDLKKILSETYRPEIFGSEDDVVSFTTFTEEAHGQKSYLLELFHGPTNSFKDYALQLLGRLFEYELKRRGSSMTIVGATSGDTGSAAIAGLAGKPNIDVFMLFPRGRVSEIQEKQMTSVLDDNINVVEVEGNFDTCQQLVKQTFSDIPFRTSKNLSSVNSINWARVLAQICYYFHAYFTATSKQDQRDGARVVFSVPTGNFGDILAGFYAQKLGLPVEKLVLSTNENDVLKRFFDTGEYSLAPLIATLSPAMNIVNASNFERFLFHIFGEDSTKLKEKYEALAEGGKFSVSGEELEKARGWISAFMTDDKTCKDVIERYSKKELNVCPHTSCAIFGLESYLSSPSLPSSPSSKYVCLATADPAKFLDETKELYTTPVVIPEGLGKLEGDEVKTRKRGCEPEVEALKKLISESLEKKDGGDLTKKFTVKVPCSSSNFGSGYDVMGLALSLYLTISVEATLHPAGMKEHPEPIVTIIPSGRNADLQPTGIDNLIWKTILFVLSSRFNPVSIQEIVMRVHNEVPLARGLGSSGTAIAAGGLIASHLIGGNEPLRNIVEICAKMEGHPDNVTPSLMGGFVASCKTEEGYAMTQIPISDEIKVVIGIPDMELSTSESRRVLPTEYSTESVVFNLQRVAMLAGGALSTTNKKLISEAVRDSLHQPFRAPLVPPLNDCLSLLDSSSPPPGLLGVFLSGSGPCIGAFACGDFDEIGALFVKIFEKYGVDCEYKVLDVVKVGGGLIRN